MLKQYQTLKAQYPQCILFFRLGDFYEMFYEDAKLASGILNVVLTSRDAGKSGRIPMCGIPYHAKDSYIAKLIKAGMKVAICEQVEDPALAKGLVKREIIRVITSGTYIDENNYESRYLLSLAPGRESTGLAIADITQGTLWTNEYRNIQSLQELMVKLPANECIFPIAHEEKIKEFFRYPALRSKNLTLTPYEDWAFNSEIAHKSLCEHFRTNSLRGFGIEEIPRAIAATGALLEYLKQMNRVPMRHVDKISLYLEDDFVFISPAACIGLEIEELFKTIDHTLCAMGRRNLKNWLYHPLKTKDAIIRRQEAVKLIKDTPGLQQALAQNLSNLPDIEKNITRVSYGDAAAKDMLALRNAMARIPRIQELLKNLTHSLLTLDDVDSMRRLLSEAINPDVPLSNAEGALINKGYNKELDELRGIQENGRQWLKNLQAQEIKRTGINSLKIGFNQVFGYYIEITHANLKNVPDNYIRRQTLANAERFITPELKEFEEKIQAAEGNILRIGREILRDISSKLLDNSSALHKLCGQLANLDALYSLSVLAANQGYIAPEINNDTGIIIKDGRHPVVEKLIAGPFIANDTLLDCLDNRLIIITGPNMSGKSTYIRQNAVLVILTQMGSFIPAKSAQIGLVDKIFTRIGAHDEISKGQSTFMVEMNEAAGILNNLTERSLVILDEIGRGTSTYDGLSLAWAIAEYLQKHKSRCLFATHFHELTALAEDLEGVKNYNVAVKEWNNEVVFLHKIIPGGTDDSYGIYVARLAGIPKEITQRANQLLMRLELSGKLHDKIRKAPNQDTQLELFKSADAQIKNDIAGLDINALTPMQALQKIQEWKEKIGQEEINKHE